MAPHDFPKAEKAKSVVGSIDLDTAVQRCCQMVYKRSATSLDSTRFWFTQYCSASDHSNRNEDGWNQITEKLKAAVGQVQ